MDHPVSQGKASPSRSRPVSVLNNYSHHIPADSPPHLPKRRALRGTRTQRRQAKRSHSKSDSALRPDPESSYRNQYRAQALPIPPPSPESPTFPPENPRIKLGPVAPSNAEQHTLTSFPTPTFSNEPRGTLAVLLDTLLSATTCINTLKSRLFTLTTTITTRPPLPSRIPHPLKTNASQTATIPQHTVPDNHNSISQDTTPLFWPIRWPDTSTRYRWSPEWQMFVKVRFPSRVVEEYVGGGV